MIAKDVDPNDGALPIGIGALDDIIVGVLLVAELLEALEDKVEQGLEVLRTGARHEDVGVAVGDRQRHGQTERRRLASPSSGRQSHGRGQRLRGDGVGEGEHGPGLVDRLALGHDDAHVRRVGQTGL